MEDINNAKSVPTKEIKLKRGPKLKSPTSKTLELIELRDKAVGSEADYKKYRREYQKLYHRDYRKNFQLVTEIAKSGDVVGAYAKLFPNVKNPINSLRSRMEQYPDLASMMPKLLDAQGLSLIFGTSKLRDLLEAKRPIVVGKEMVMVEDNAAQTENLKTLFKLHKTMGEGQQVTINQQKVEFNCDADSVQKLSEIVQKIEQLEQNVDFSKHTIEIKEATDANTSV